MIVLPKEGEELKAACVSTAVSLCSERVQEAYQDLPEALKTVTEDELYKIKTPDFLTEKLRITFWNEYEAAIQEGRPIVVENFLRGVCTKQAFYARFLTDHHRVAWLFIPPSDYQAAVDALNRLGLRRQFEILSMPFEDGKGRPDARIMDIVHRVAEAIDKRVKGQYAEKQDININQKSVNVNVNQNTNGGPDLSKAALGVDSVAKLQADIQALEQRKLQLARERVLRRRDGGDS